MPGRKRLPSDGKQTKEAFSALGEPEGVARVLGALLGHRRLGLVEVSRRARLSGLTVRRALSLLEDRGWVQAMRLPSKKRGRRPYGYTLTASRRVMLDYYEGRAKRQARDAFASAVPW